MITRRRFTKGLGAAAAVATVGGPRFLWSTETPTGASAATDLYNKSFILDCNALAGIGFPISGDDPAGVTKLIDSFVPTHLTCGLRRSPSIRRLPAGHIVGSGVNVVKATLGGAQEKFEGALAAIAKAELFCI